MFDRFSGRIARIGRHRSSRFDLRGLLARLGDRGGHARSRPHRHAWDDADLQVPSGRLAPAVIRRDRPYRARG